jgi:succinoglycan biosynthesis transport protein ExoP
MREISPWRNQHPAPIPDSEIEYVFRPESQEPGLRDYWKMLVKRRRLALMVILTVFGITAFITWHATPLYTAGATVKIESSNAPVPGYGETHTSSSDYFQTQLALLKSRALAARVITALDLESNPKFKDSPSLFDIVRRWITRNISSGVAYVFDNLLAFWGTPPSVEEKGQGGRREYILGVHPGLVALYLRLLEVTPVPNTSLARVQFTTTDPQLSQQLSAAHAATYIRMHLETRFELTKEAREFLERKLSELKIKVQQSEDSVNRFRQAHGVVSLEGNQNIVTERMVDLNKRLTEARAQRIELESLSRIVKDKNFEYLSQVIDNNLILQLKVRLEGLEAEQAKMATIYKPDHPRLIELGDQINQARRRLRVEINNIVRKIESDYMAARAKEAALQAEADRQKQTALNLKEMSVEYTLLQGELDANRTVYESVVKRLNETSVSNDSPISNLQIVEPAEIPLAPSSPRVERNFLLATVFGLFLAVVLAFFLEHFNTTVRTPDDVWRSVAVPTLGVVPHLKALARREYGLARLPKDSPLRRLAHRWTSGGSPFSPALTVSYHPLSILAESYRTIRTVLLLGQAEKPPQVILLTSAHPGEGKTSITLNLAITLAQSGRSVVVVDADLRKGNCHAHLGLQNSHGLSHVLTGSLNLEEVVQSTAVSGLFIISRGAVPPSPTDLLASERMKQVLESLRERFDFVLIDTPPAIAISDAVLLSVMSDGVLVVLRNQSTTTDAARHVVERLHAVGAPILGAVLNGIDVRDPDYTDYRAYYSSYYASAQRDSRKRS